MYAFLRVNDVSVIASEADSVNFVLRHLESGTCTKENLDDWLRESTKTA